MYRTTEGNREDGIWYPINAGIGDLGVLSLAVSPNYNRCDRALQFNQGDSTLFVGTKSGRIYKSADGGATWTQTASGLPSITAPPNYSIAALAISPNYTSDSTLYASIQSAAAGGPFFNAPPDAAGKLSAWNPIVRTGRNWKQNTGSGFLTKIFSPGQF